MSIAPPPPTIHEAFLGPGPSGFVDYAAEIAFDAAVAQRLAGLDVVVSGDDISANRRLAREIEAEN
jgi:hypothetical protein